MGDHSSLILINKLCDSFETFGGKECEGPKTYDAAEFLNKLKSTQQTPPLNEAMMVSLTTELMAIELQRPPFPSEAVLREKYPSFGKEITSAVQLTQQKSNGTDASAFSKHSTVGSDEFKLPIEERIDRALTAYFATDRADVDPHGSNSLTRRTFGRYQLAERLGAGGFGIVYRARDPLMRRDVAIKIPRTSLMDEPSDRTRFERETTALSQLNHPNIVTAYHAEQVDGYFCLISEYLTGGNLEAWLGEQGNQLSSDGAVAIALQLCDALNHAHDLGVVHCDIKPSNIIVCNKSDKDPLVKLTDFGLARIIKDGSAATSTGLAIGTLQYMSPEQLMRNNKVEVTTDIYSLGIVLYRLLAGELPFDSENEIALISQIIERQPLALQSKQFKVPSNLAAIVSKCLMKQPEDRYQSISELRSDLKRFSKREPVSAKPLGIAGRVSHWLKSKHRIREAGIYALSLHLVLSTWATFSIPVYHVTGLLKHIGIDRMPDYLLTVIMLLTMMSIPNIWAALNAIQLRRRGILVGCVFSTVGTAMMALQLFVEQRAPHLAEGRGDVGFRERTPTGEPREDTGQAVGQAFEHRLALRTYWNRPADETRRTCSAASKALIADANLSRQSGLQNPTTDPL